MRQGGIRKVTCSNAAVAAKVGVRLADTGLTRPSRSAILRGPTPHTKKGLPNRESWYFRIARLARRDHKGQRKSTTQHEK